MSSFVRHIKNNFPAYILLAVFGFVFFYHLDYNTLGSWDEGWYASIAREIVRTGDIMHLMWNGYPYFDHPPLGFWLMAVSFKLFGISEFSTRLPSAVLGLLSIIVLYEIGKSLFNKSTGFVAAIILGTSVWYTIRVRSGNLDAIFVFFYVLSIYLAIRASKRFAWFPLAMVSFACLMLSKTLVGLSAAPIIIAMVSNQFRNYRRAIPIMIIGLLCGAVVLLPWYYVNYHAYPNFVTHHFLEIGTRSKTLMSYFELHAAQPLYFLHMGIRKWYYLWIAGFVYLVISLRFLQKSTFITLLWNVVILYPFLTARETQLWHLIPVYAPVALITAYGWYCAFTDVSSIILNLIRRKSPPKMMVNRVAAGFYVIMMVFIAAVQIKIFYPEVYPQNKYIPDDVDIARRAHTYSEKIFLDDDFLPLAVYYSGRTMLPMYDLASFGESTDKNTLVKLFQSNQQDFIAITRWWAVKNLDKEHIPYRIRDKNNSFSIVSR